jgi:hypothetical protein
MNKPRGILLEDDRRLRDLERRAKQGDLEAVAALRQAQRRAGRTIPPTRIYSLFNDALRDAVQDVKQHELTVTSQTTLSPPQRTRDREYVYEHATFYLRQGTGPSQSGWAIRVGMYAATEALQAGGGKKPLPAVLYSVGAAGGTTAWWVAQVVDDLRRALADALRKRFRSDQIHRIKVAGEEYSIINYGTWNRRHWTGESLDEVDQRGRDLERRAKQGDPQARAALKAHRIRTGEARRFDLVVAEMSDEVYPRGLQWTKRWVRVGRWEGRVDGERKSDDYGHDPDNYGDRFDAPWIIGVGAGFSIITFMVYASNESDAVTAAEEEWPSEFADWHPEYEGEPEDGGPEIRVLGRALTWEVGRKQGSKVELLDGRVVDPVT